MPLEVLSEDNLNYASEALREYAGDYLRARYSGSMEGGVDIDRRVHGQRHMNRGGTAVDGPPHGHQEVESG